MSKKSKALKVGKKQVVAMFVALGFKTAARWSDERLVGKIKKLPDVISDETECEDEDAKALLDSILKALASGGEVEVTAKAAKAKKADKAKKAADKKEEPADKDDEDDEDDEDDDDDDEETTKEKKARLKKEKAAKSKKDKKEKKAKKPKKVGVISSIVEFLTAATEKKPVSKDKLVERLVKRFPDREATSMAKTCDVQISYHLKKSKGIEVQKNKRGYWVESDE